MSSVRPCQLKVSLLKIVANWNLKYSYVHLYNLNLSLIKKQKSKLGNNY